jgi:hypothetical protein
MGISVPDPQVLEMDALDEALGNYAQELYEAKDYGEYHAFCDAWHEIDSDPLVFCSSDIDEYFGPDYEEGYATMDHAMSKDMANRIQQKRQLIVSINEDED